MTGFRRVGDGVAARFARPEAAIIRDLVEQVVELVEPSTEADRRRPVTEADELARMVGMGDGRKTPSRPMIRCSPGCCPMPTATTRTPPASSAGSPSPACGRARSPRAMTLLETLPPGGGRIRLTADQAEAWLRSLNDVRLALGTRLGVTDDFDALDEDVEIRRSPLCLRAGLPVAGLSPGQPGGGSVLNEHSPSG